MILVRLPLAGEPGGSMRWKLEWMSPEEAELAEQLDGVTVFWPDKVRRLSQEAG